MLAGIWLIFGAAINFWCCYKEVKSDEETDRDDPFRWIFGSLASTVLALAVTFGATVVPVFKWLLVTLPEHGTDLNKISAFIVCGIICVVYVAGVPLASLFGLTFRDDSACATKKTKRSALSLVWPKKR